MINLLHTLSLTHKKKTEETLQNSVHLSECKQARYAYISVTFGVLRAKTSSSPISRPLSLTKHDQHLSNS